MNTINLEVEKLVQKELEHISRCIPPFRRDRKDLEDVFIAKKLARASIDLACEAIQVAAMAQKVIDSQKEREKSEGN